MRFFTTERLGPTQSLTPEGFLVIEGAPLARIGPQLYHESEVPVKGGAGGRVIVDRRPEEVFRPETIASINGKAIALDHPDDDISPDNYQDLLVGTVMNPRQGAGVLDNLLLGDLVIYNKDAIKAIRDKRILELSLGYDADYVEDGIGRGHQKNIYVNHLALVRDGRCGASCRIHDHAARIPFRDSSAVSPKRRKALHLHIHR